MYARMSSVEPLATWRVSSGVMLVQVFTANRVTAANRVPESHRSAWRCQGEDSTGLLHGTHTHPS